MSYEFTAEENKTFGALATAMRMVGYTSILLGVLHFVEIVVLFVTQPVMHVAILALVRFPVALVFATTGLWLEKGAKSFQLVVDTQGSDVSHLMSALNHLKGVFEAWRTLIILAIAAFILGSVMEPMTRSDTAATGPMGTQPPGVMMGTEPSPASPSATK